MLQKIRKLKNKKGFTLVELIIVIVIIGVLAAILVPTMTSYINTSRISAADTSARNVYDTVQNWLQELYIENHELELSETGGFRIKCTGTNAANDKFEITYDTLTDSSFKGSFDADTSLDNKFETDFSNAKADFDAYVSIDQKLGGAVLALYSEEVDLSTFNSTGTINFKSSGKVDVSISGVPTEALIGSSPKINDYNVDINLITGQTTPATP